MTRTSTHSPARATGAERAFVLGGFALAVPFTAASLASGAGAEAIGPLWMAAVLWTIPSSLACALRRGIRRGDWSAFRRYRLPGDGELVDWTTRTGQYAYLRIAEEHERLMRGD